MFRLKKPKIPSLEEQQHIFELIKGQDNQDNKEFAKIIVGAEYPAYLYWDKVKYKVSPRNLSKDQAWFLIKTARKIRSNETPIKSENGIYFRLNKLIILEEFLHEVDLNMGGKLMNLPADFTEKDKHTFISRGVLEEAIASSQLEGANTTRKYAKKMILEGIKPRNESEHMILNNYKAMQLIENDYKNTKLNLELLFNLHEVIVQNTHIPQENQGRLRDDSDEIVVADKLTGEVYHEAPKRKFLEEEIKRLINFANDELEGEFIHPLIKAILLHFWFGYLHPFTDGNGRLARLLFYWYLLKKGYWAFAYLPISTVIKKAPSQYSMAYVYSEQDDCDVTYFVDFNIRKIQEAMMEFEVYIKEKFKENRQMNSVSKEKYQLNERQIQLLQYLHAEKNNKTSLKVHININHVSKVTAIKDLKKLQTDGFLKAIKVGKLINYYATEKTDELFKKDP